MSRYLNLKTGGLVLSAEKDGEPASELVFVNGRQVGETPFSGTVPVCAEIGIGSGKSKVDVKVAYKQTVRYKHKVEGVLVDSRDRKKYKIVKVGNQVWMGENLNYNASGSKCYDKQESNCQKYGRLYNWNTARDVCPSGWHLPSDAEWIRLTDFVGGSSTAGTKLKATSGWNTGSGYKPGTDEYGFSALPGGFSGSSGSFTDVGNGGCWWSSMEYNASYAWNRLMYYRNAIVGREYDDKSRYFSVRCVKDNEAEQAGAKAAEKFVVKTQVSEFDMLTDSRDGKISNVVTDFRDCKVSITYPSRVAIINTVDDHNTIGISELAHLTDRFRETVAGVLPHSVMTTESIIAFLGSSYEHLVKECRAACLVELGKKMSADYVAQARIGRLGGNLTINTELYSSKSGILIGSFRGGSKDILGLMAIIDEKAPALFKNKPCASSDTRSLKK
jgi:uncharacterized protein (TIGR02145 family)